MTGQPLDPAAVLALIDDVATRYAAPPWDEEIARARAAFDRSRGQVFDDEELFGEHMAAFLEWYTLERPLPGGQPPVVADLDLAAAEGRVVPRDELALRRALRSSHRTLLELRELLPGGLRLLDMIGGGFWRVERLAPRDGLRPKEIFEGRLVPWAGKVVLGPVCWWHPPQAASLIHSIVREAAGRGLLGPDLVDRLAGMRLKHSRFRNIAISRIYALDGLKGGA